LIRRVADPADGRVVQVAATATGRALLHAGQRQRVASLAAEVRRLSVAERRAVLAALPLIEQLAGR
jgi:DNA-binding MarR family transcriptional regulator